MFRPFKAVSAVILTAAVTLTASGIAFAEAPKPTLTESDASGAYSANAKRVSYKGDFAEFSVDIPAELAPALSDGAAKEIDDGSTQWELFYGEDSTLYIDCCFHKKEGGYAAEMSAWWQSLEDGSLDMDIFYGSDLDGTDYSVVDLRYVYSEDDGTEILIGEYPWDEDTWINISVGGSTADMSDLREDICVMLGSFSRNAVSLPSNDENIAVPACVESLGTYSVPAYRVVYYGDMAEFSVDFPNEFNMYDHFTDPLNTDGGSTVYELLQAQYGDSAAYINLVEYENGFEGRKEYWQQYPDYVYSSGIPDADGTEFHIIVVESEYDGHAVEIIAAEYPWNDSSYIEIIYRLAAPVDEKYRTDIYEMLNSFSRDAEKSADTAATAEIPENTESAENADTPAQSNPNTGAAVPAVFTAACAAVVMGVSGRKIKRK